MFDLPPTAQANTCPQSLGAGSSSKKTTTTTTRIPADHHQQAVAQGGAGQPAQGRIADSGSGQQKKLTQQEANTLYEERMEDEYAKREGGA